MPKMIFSALTSFYMKRIHTETLNLLKSAENSLFPPKLFQMILENAKELVRCDYGRPEPLPDGQCCCNVDDKNGGKVNGEVGRENAYFYMR